MILRMRNENLAEKEGRAMPSKAARPHPWNMRTYLIGTDIYIYFCEHAGAMYDYGSKAASRGKLTSPFECNRKGYLFDTPLRWVSACQRTGLPGLRTAARGASA